MFLHIHKFAKPQKEGGTSGTQNVRFCNLRTCGSLVPKKKDGKFANAQFTNHNCGNLGHPNTTDVEGILKLLLPLVTSNKSYSQLYK